MEVVRVVEIDEDGRVASGDGQRRARRPEGEEHVAKCDRRRFAVALAKLVGADDDGVSVREACGAK